MPPVSSCQLLSHPGGSCTFPLSSFRSDIVSVLESYYYDDGCESCGTDIFSREPFIVKFSSPTTREQSHHMVAVSLFSLTLLPPAPPAQLLA